MPAGREQYTKVTRMIVQIYEVVTPQEAAALAQAGVDHAGVLVGPGDFPRERSCRQARAILAALPAGATRLALSLSGDPLELERVARDLAPDIFHIGAALERISPEQTRAVKSAFPRIQIMRSIPVTGEDSIGWAQSYDGVADWLLLDSHRPGDIQIGAQGFTHDWSVSARIVRSVGAKVILAGGLGPGNVASAIARVAPYGVDSKTRTDRDDGKGKDLDRVRAFVLCAKQAPGQTASACDGAAGAAADMKSPPAP
jgi:phosphoribosylanthranilate isomerase